MCNNMGTDTLNGGTGEREYGGLKIPLFRVFYDDSSLDPLDIPTPVTSLSISHYSYVPSIATMIPLP